LIVGQSSVGQPKYYEIGIYYFSTRHTTLRI